MNNIIFFKGKKTKNTLDDWKLAPLEPITTLSGSGTVSFMARLADVPVVARFRDMVDFLSDGVDKVELSDEPGKAYEFDWSVDYTDLGFKGTRVDFTYKTKSQPNSKWDDIPAEKPNKKSEVEKETESQKNSPGFPEKSNSFDQTIF